jgi:hypothetical protein
MLNFYKRLVDIKMISRGANNKELEINVVGSSIFGRYDKISTERTMNMFISDETLVPYAGYKILIDAMKLGNTGIGKEGRGIFTSTKFNKMVIVIDANVFLVSLTYDQTTQTAKFVDITFIGSLATSTGVVYITENNVPQILISDNQNLYIYSQALGVLTLVPGLNFTPGYITFHDTYFIAAASEDNTYSPPANNTWRLSLSNQGYTSDGTSMGTTAWPSDNLSGTSYVGLLETKPDNVQAVVRFPSKGNMIFVMGSIVTEAWFDTGAQLFPYQRNNQFNIDYGCLSPASVAYMDEMVVWLAKNEKSGPIIMFSDGGMPTKITTDGIDYAFSQLQSPQDSQGFLYRQDGHLFYHINFYTDNISYFYDFNTQKFFNASDQNDNYFIASEIAFYGNQYYFVTRNNGNLFAFDTVFTTYQDVPKYPSIVPYTYIIPRFRICKNIRIPSQDNFILNDIGFTIESGETDYLIQYPVLSSDFLLLTDETNFLLTDLTNLEISSDFNAPIYTTPIVFLALSYDGGASFENEVPQYLPGIGYRKNKLQWWQCGMSNDIVPKFNMSGIGRFVAFNGRGNVRI